MVLGDPCERVIQPQRGRDPQLRTCCPRSFFPECEPFEGNFMTKLSQACGAPLSTLETKEENCCEFQARLSYVPSLRQP